MKRLSSKRTFFIKRVFPAFWFGFLALFVVLALTLPRAPHAALPPRGFVLLPVAMAVFGFFLFRRLLFDLADEVWDCGDALLVRRGGQEERVPLSNVMNVGGSSLVNPPRVTLRLVRAGRFGDEISFTPITPFRLNPFARNAVIDDLIVRVDRARRWVREQTTDASS